MADDQKPWEKYTQATPTADGPWNKYATEQPGSKSIAQQLGVTNPIAAVPLDLLEGVGAGVMSTVRGASQLAHKVIPAIPEVPESYAKAPDSIAGKVGKFGEQAAEFALPMGAVSKATKGLRTLLRMGAEGLAAGGVSAIQSGGDPSATVAGAAAGAAGPAIGAGAEAVANSRIPQKLYQSALKPTWAMVKKEGLSMLDTGLKEQIPVSAEGLGIVEKKINDIRQQITNGIQARAAQGRTVDTAEVLKSLDGLEDFYRNTAAPEAALDTLKGIRDQFAQYHGQQIPVDKAQKIKINTYQELKNSYGEMASAKIEGLKQVARGLKEQISSVFPEIAGLNEQQSKLLGLDDALYRAVWRIENHQMMGIGSPLAAAAGHALLGGPGAAAGFAGKLLLDDPTLKSKLAIAIAKSGVKNPAGVVSTRLTALKGVMDKAASSVAEADAALPKAASVTDQKQHTGDLAEVIGKE